MCFVGTGRCIKSQISYPIGWSEIIQASFTLCIVIIDIDKLHLKMSRFRIYQGVKYIIIKSHICELTTDCSLADFAMQPPCSAAGVTPALTSDTVLIDVQGEIPCRK